MRMPSKFLSLGERFALVPRLDPPDAGVRGPRRARGPLYLRGAAGDKSRGAEGLVLPGLRKTAPRSDRDFRRGRDPGSEVPAQRKENSVIRFPLQFIYIN